MRGLVLLAATTALYSQPYRPMMFVGRSMEPTYKNHEIAFTTKADGEYNRGDIVVIQRPDGPIVKRVAYVEGDRIMQVFNHGEWSNVLFMAKVRHPDNHNFRYLPVPEGYVYVIGDNVGHSFDSRDFGAVPTSSIIAKMVNPRPPSQAWGEMLENTPVIGKTW